jgi:glycosyltransferase involved in cell wall biosynthesis
MELAVIIPVYNETEVLGNNFEVIYEQLSQLDIHCKYIFVDDGSKDSTWLDIQVISKKYDNVSAIRFARNFGKEMAICAGLDNIMADRYLIMDSDLQHPPACVRDMLALMDKEKADIVDGVKDNRGKESLKYKICAKNFYRLLNVIAGLSLNNSTDFKLLTDDVVSSIRSFNESDLFFRGIVDWVGYKKVLYPFSVNERIHGSSSFSTLKLIKLSLDAVLSHTSKPLYLTMGIGLIFLCFAVILGIQSLYNYFTHQAVSGFSTVIILILLTSSLLMFSTGMIGLYISRIYNEVKRRPRYVISGIINNK